MTWRILVPVDGSPLATEALRFALERHPDASITAFHVVDVVSAADQTVFGIDPVTESELYEAGEERADAVLDEATALAAEFDTDIDTRSVRGFPREAIIDHVETESVDQVVVGSHGRSGLERLAVGSVAESVVRHASVPVTIVHGDAEVT
jgi:nucleotide-binding universal stress UspA family protein